jgi:hypothetical protein
VRTPALSANALYTLAPSIYVYRRPEGMHAPAATYEAVGVLRPIDASKVTTSRIIILQLRVHLSRPPPLALRGGNG